jgi:phospholipid N-methyltransferase
VVSQKHRLRDKLKFLGTFLRSPFRIGSLWPSSRQLAEAMVLDVHLQRGDVVVEYGPGTGPMTAALARCMPEGVRFLGIEHDEGFCRVLEQRFPRLEFVRGSAEHVEQYLAERGLPRARLIVSGLPFASMPLALQESIVGATKRALRDDGVFRTFAYVHAYGSRRARRFREFMAEQFRGFKRSKAVLLNMPPAYVLTYRHGSASA